MARRFIIMGAMLLAACGVETQQDGSSTASQTPTTAIGHVPSTTVRAQATMLSNSALTKVVVSQSTPVESAVDLGFEMGAPTCTTDSDCFAYPGAACSSTLRVCTVTRYVKTRFYLENTIPDSTGGVGIAVPCDGRSYSVEVYGGDDSSPRVVKAIWAADGITIPSTTCTAPASVPWVNRMTGATSLLPAFSMPMIYDASVPNHATFSVGIQNLVYPWATATTAWDVTYGSPAVTGTKSPATVTFTAPPAGTASISLLGTFQLDGSLTVGTETPWHYPAAPATAPVYGSATISF